MLKIKEDKINIIKTTNYSSARKCTELLNLYDINNINIIRQSEILLNRHLNVLEKGSIIIFQSNLGISNYINIPDINIITVNFTFHNIAIINKKNYNFTEIEKHANSYKRLKKLKNWMK